MMTKSVSNPFILKNQNPKQESDREYDIDYCFLVFFLLSACSFSFYLIGDVSIRV